MRVGQVEKALQIADIAKDGCGAQPAAGQPFRPGLDLLPCQLPGQLAQIDQQALPGYPGLMLHLVAGLPAALCEEVIEEQAPGFGAAGIFAVQGDAGQPDDFNQFEGAVGLHG